MQVVVATHAEMATGIKKTTEFIMGDQPNLHAFPAYSPGNENFLEKLTSFIEHHRNESVVVFTDIIGGSVNSQVTQMLSRFDKVYLIAGVNLPMVIQLLLTHEDTGIETIHKVIAEGREGIRFVNEELQGVVSDFDDF
jgi:mannose/fructose-specific phosphotransferase system component IIA